MKETDAGNNTQPTELDATQAEEVAGGFLWTPEQVLTMTAQVKQAYENLVDFTSHVIDRVAGGSGTP